MFYNVLIVTIAIIAVYALLMVFYLNAEKKNNGENGFKRATALKLSLSGLFCAVGIISYSFLINTGSVNWFSPQLFILLGLFAAFAGDYFLQYIRLNEKKYIAGITCFCATQGLFITALLFLRILDISQWVITIAITAAVLLCILALMKKQDWRLESEKTVLTVYTVLLVFMAAKAVTDMAGDLSASSLLFAAGAVLFLVSDMLLGIWNYHSNKRIHANMNWITYYWGMLLIALSIMPAFLIPVLHFEF